MSPLVYLAADWDLSRLLDQTPGGAGVWDGLRFTVRPVPECDYLVLLNNRRLEPLTVRCPPNRVWALMQEPYIPGLYDWMIEGHEPFARVYTHHVLPAHPRHRAAPPAIPWAVGLTYDELHAAAIPAKTHAISWITSDLSFLPGHRLRNRLAQHFQRAAPDLVDLYGRGIRPISRKWEALAPYRFSLAVENSFGPHLWTEKLADCFLSWTVPLYYGCTNLTDYFPAESFIPIDAAHPDAVIRQLRSLDLEREWRRRLPAIQEARRRILDHDQLFPFLAAAIHADHAAAAPAETIHIPGYAAKRLRHRLRYVERQLRTGEVVDLARAAFNKWKYLQWSGKP